MDMSVDEQLKDANFELYLTNLQGFVHDDEKIVTYKWLSNELSIDINLSKELLTQFVADQKSSKSDPISVSYLIYGGIEDGFKSLLVRDTDLPEARKQFKNVISEQIFSVQKQTNLRDLNILYTVDKSLGKDCIGKIGFDRDIARKETKKVYAEIKKDVSSGDSKSNIVEKKSGISNMFQNQTKKNIQKEITEIEVKNSKDIPSNKSSPVKKSPETKTKQTKQPVSKGGIANFFNKQPKSSEKSPVQSTKENKTNIKSPPPKQEVKPIATKKEETPPKHNYRDILDSDTDDDLGFEVKTEKVIEEKKETNKEDKNKKAEKPQTKRRRNAKDKDGNKAKRRKRIVQQGGDSESSEDDIFAKERSESPVASNKKAQISDDEDMDVVPPTPVSQHTDSKKKRVGRQVDKTYLDDEGFFVTKKEFIVETESDSDNENMENNKKENVDKNSVNNKKTTEEKTENKNKSEAKVKNEV
ncbi:DNA polymerase delta subunit 3-like [Chrysoperla carnea]|uniref:DNA polymerase delta subunit 3-like n=1 Tax=Chrysoperla carnea TaxID=189513 RepID=UPI001D098C2A|nr:DNA polymerase delta subunit 3-like [Chrysoperla carnea]